MEPWIAAIAAAQCGVISKSQIESMEISRSKLRTQVARGWLVPEAPRVYAIAGSPYSWERSLMAGLLCLGDESWVSHEAAAALHEFDRAMKEPVEFTVRRSRRGLEVPFTVHTTATLPEIDTATVGKFRCVSATRTIIDLARARIGRYRLESAIDSAVHSGASSPVVLALRLAELRSQGRWGVRLLDRLLVDSGGHTRLERLFLQIVREAGLPRPATQVVFRRDGRAHARVDFRFEPFQVVVEVSGKKGHSSTRERAKDAQRRNELQDAGHAVYEYTWEDVNERRNYVATTMTERLHRAGWRR
jgi:very-short-patch-repair endonuclease